MNDNGDDDNSHLSEVMAMVSLRLKIFIKEKSHIMFEILYPSFLILLALIVSVLMDKNLYHSISVSEN